MPYFAPEQVSVSAPIAPQRHRNGAVRWNEERYRTLFEWGPIAVYACDAAGVIQEFNHRAAELWGRAPVTGDTDKKFCGSFKLFRPDGSLMPHEQCPMAEVIAGTLSEACEQEVVIERSDGSRITVLANIRALRNEHGDILGAINCFHDITIRKETEAALRASDRRKSEFLALLAHELRNPLAPIQQAVDVLKRARRLASARSPILPGEPGSTATPDGSLPTDAAIDVLGRQVAQMARLVDDLLDAGRISGGKMVLRKERVELSSIVQQVIETVGPLCQALDQELTVTLPPAPVHLNADPTRLAQIVGNLLTNASKFNERGGRIWLTVESVGRSPEPLPTASGPAGPNAMVVIRVRDTGVGIAADQLPQIFDMFTQVDTALERSVTGLGIGLTLVKTLTEMHGGTVQAASAGLRCGSEFIVSLPVVETTTEASVKIPRTPAASTIALRILIVDDNRDAAAMLAMLLRFGGHDTYLAHDGVEAVDAAMTLHPDIVLLDIGLPRLNGYEVARTIRARSHQATRPVLVALTGWAQAEDRRRSEEAGFDAHFIKPVDELALGQLLMDVGALKREVRN